MSHFITLLAGPLSRVGLLRVRTGIRRAIWGRVACILVILSLLTQNSAQAIGLSVAPAAQASASTLKSISNSPEGAAADSGTARPGLSAADWGTITEQMTQTDPQVYSLVARPFPSDSDATDAYAFGYAASLSGDTLVVGDPSYGDIAHSYGAAFVFYRDWGGSNAWGQVAKLTPPDGTTGDEFGLAVSADEDIVVVGSYGNLVDNQGAAYVFSRNQGGADAWGFVSKLTAFDGGGYDNFGWDVSVSGDTIVVGTSEYSSSRNNGAAYVFNRDPVSGAWLPGPKLTAFDGADSGRSWGESVSVSGDTIFVGAPKAVIGGIQQGAAYVFYRDPVSGAWLPGPKLTVSGSVFLGSAVSLSGDTAVVTAGGAAYVFNRDRVSDSWQRVAQLSGSETTTNERFGDSVSLSGNTIVVGAPWATIDGRQYNGAAYIFSCNQGGANGWGLVDKLVGDSALGRFGEGVSVSGNTVTVGAWGGGSLHPEGEAYVYEAAVTLDQCRPETTVTVDTTSIEMDGDSSSVSALLAPGGRGADELISFPEAITAVNNDPSSGFTINFNLPHGATISLDGTLTLIASNTTIDGDTDGDDKPDVMLAAGLIIFSSNNVIRNLAIKPLEIYGTEAHDNTIVGSYIGTNVDGYLGHPKLGDGLIISNGAHHNIVENNLIAGNDLRAGVLINAAHDNEVRGNRIGLDVDSIPLHNEFGVWIGNGASRNIIGGNRTSTICEAPCNIIHGGEGTGIVIDGTGTISNIVRGNYIGGFHDGIRVQGGAEENEIGGYRESTACTGPCNVIGGGLKFGIVIDGMGTIRNVVQGNFIGLDAAGDKLPNSLAGISVEHGASHNLIGGLRTSEVCDGPCNVIGNNGVSGVLMSSGAMNNEVQGNHIGVNADGLDPMTNDVGIYLHDGAQGNIIGGGRVPTYDYKCVESCNLIGGNFVAGVHVAGDSTRANAIRGNHIFGNGGLGIDLSDVVVTPNDPDDSDTGPNDLMNFPLGLTAVFDSNTNKTTITGVIKTMNPATVMVDIYASEIWDAISATFETYFEGEQYLGVTIPDDSGNFTLTIDGQLPASILSATATDSNGSTSEFGTRPPLLFIADMAGSQLDDGYGGDELWPGVTRSDHRRLSLFPSDHPSASIYASDVIRDVTVPGSGIVLDNVYRPLLEYLKVLGGYREYPVEGNPLRLTTIECIRDKSNNPNLFVFPYDWRRSNIDNAKDLKLYMDCIQELYPGSKVDILAHGMGGLLARRYILRNPTDHHVNKFVTIGTPWLGAPKSLYVLETGEWGNFKSSFIMTDATTRYIAGSFHGVHELLPGGGYSILSGQSPLFEDGWDFDGDGQSIENYTYGDYIKAINDHYGFDDKRNHDFKPGNTGNDFHVGLQDDWSADIGVNTDVNYYHLIGVQDGETTIRRIAATYWTICSTLFNCYRLPIHEFKRFMTRGDEAVPLLSAERIGNGYDYNAPNAQLIYFPARLCGGNDLVQHTGLNSNLEVQNTVRALLTIGSRPESTCLGTQQTTSQSVANLSPRNQFSAIEPLPVEPYYYLTIANGTSVVVSDELGNSTASISEIFRGEVPGVDTYVMGEQVELMTIPTTGAYTVTFQTTTQPVAIELTAGTSQTATQAVRYQDLTLPPGVTAMLKITPQGAEDIRYDGDGDGIFETLITPTVSVTGALANDLEPPTITVSRSESLITLTAQDSESGVRDLFYSLDGTNYQPYTAPFQIAPSQTTLYAFANDNVANRATLVYPLFSSATLIVIKHVVNDNGGAATAADFTLNVTGNGPGPASFPGDETGTSVTLNAGDYSVDETGPTGYAMSLSAECTGTIAVGETRTCTVTNDDIQPTLTVIKHVVNDNGGTATAADFTMNVNGMNVSAASFPGNETGTTVTLNVGDYNIDETGPTGYAMTLSADCSGTITIGETKTCTVTNDDIPPTLIVIKHVINNNGGMGTAANFTMTVTGTNVSTASFPGNENGTTVMLNAGNYSVSESGPSGYTASFSADCAGTVAVGEPTKICTITNESTQSVDIDIIPHSKQNRIRLDKKHRPIGMIRVAILSTSDFDAPSVVDRTSLTFGHAGDEESLMFCFDRARDVNDDGRKDLVCVFRGRLTGFQIGDTNGILKGTTLDGALIAGSDSVKIVISREDDEEEDD